jgi:hypothetical protein
MSYDSIRMLDEARSNVRGGIFPTMPVYLLRIFDFFGAGPAVMIFVQDFTIIFSLLLSLKFIGARLLPSILMAILLLSMPTVIGCMLVLWKDVTLVAFISMAITIIFWADQQNRQSAYFIFAKWLSLLAIIMATYIRFNSLTSTVVILVYWQLVFLKSRIFSIKILYILVTIFIMILGNNFINSYRIPSFEKLEPNTVLYSVMAYDLLGISGWSRESLIPFNNNGMNVQPKASLDDIDFVYSSLGSSFVQENNAKIGNKVKIFPDNYELVDIFNAWKAAVIKHPISYLNYRMDLFSEIIGFRNHPTFEPTHYNRIDENRFNIKFEERWVTIQMLEYIKHSSGWVVGKPWFIFLVSFLSFLIVLFDKDIVLQIKNFSSFSFVASIFYIFPFIFIPSSGEVRYAFPAIVLAFNPLIVYIFSINFSKINYLRWFN